MSPCELTASITAIANALACKLTRDELAYWGIVLAQLGETMGSIAALQDLCESKEESAATEDAALGEDRGTAQSGAALTSRLLP